MIAPGRLAVREPGPDMIVIMIKVVAAAGVSDSDSAGPTAVCARARVT